MNRFTMNFGITSILALALFVSACNKDNNVAISEETTVRLNIGQAYAKADPVKTAAVGRNYASAVQTVEIPFDNQYTLVATLTAETAASSSLKASNRAATVSTGSEQDPLKQGTIYYVAIFDAAGNYKETKSFTQGNAAPEFKIDQGKYTFVVYASGTNKTLPSIAVGATLASVNFEGLTADKDFMLDQVPFEVKAGQNVLNADLEHLFSQVTMKFDASALGTVTSISGATIAPSNASVDVALASGALTFNGAANPVAFNLKNTSGAIINSDSTFITTAATANGTIVLSGVSIGGSAAKNLSKGGWNIKPGVKYQLDITLKKPIEVNIGDEVWALGNLTYALDGDGNPVYSFAKTNDTYGNYWFSDYAKPKVFDVNNQRPTRDINGAAQDPCSLVLPVNTWRLPTADEINQLINNTNSGGKDNPHDVNAWAPARYVDTYDGTLNTNLGMFFGKQGNPGADRYKFLYLPYGGSYNDNNSGDGMGSQGLYLLAGNQRLQMTGSKGDAGWSINVGPAEANYAYQIRCVRK
ncbi:FimB/Mfa2 family fimbrial subunit [Sphingobacterium multivorum]|uniref:FimB/Mfa2 family fimbrial subunit n=1 Tax=Sphingobacterium multivorum TaxID=28454 RepID=UPI0031BAF71D